MRIPSRRHYCEAVTSASATPFLDIDLVHKEGSSVLMNEPEMGGEGSCSNGGGSGGGGGNTGCGVGGGSCSVGGGGGSGSGSSNCCCCCGSGSSSSGGGSKLHNSQTYGTGIYRHIPNAMYSL